MISVRDVGRLLLCVSSLVGLWPQAAWSAEQVGQRFAGYYKELQEAGQYGPFGLPLAVRSEAREDRVSAEIRGVLDHSFQKLVGLLTRPVSWCDFVSLTPNIKACTFQEDGRQAVLTLYIGWRGYRSPEASSPQVYQFVVRARQPEYAAISVTATQGLLGTRAHQFDMEAAAVAGKTVFVLRSSYEPSALSRTVTTVYLTTLGRDKIGFTRVPHDGGSGYVRGIQGMIERNVMRYYLALKAFLDTQGPPNSEQFETRISTAYDLMESYAAQLHLMEKAEYLDIKRRERLNQLRLQQKIGSASPSG
jgi:hypothetical protein